MNLPRPIDDCELWEIAAAIGANDAVDPKDQPIPEGPLPYNVYRAQAGERGERIMSIDEYKRARGGRR